MLAAGVTLALTLGRVVVFWANQAYLDSVSGSWTALAVDLAAAHRTLRLMERSDDPKMREAAQELRAHTLGGLFLGGRGANARRTVEEVPALAWAAVVRDLPVIRQTWDLLRVMPDAYFKFNRAIESVAQRAAL